MALPPIPDRVQVSLEIYSSMAYIPTSISRFNIIKSFSVCLDHWTRGIQKKCAFFSERTYREFPIITHVSSAFLPIPSDSSVLFTVVFLITIEISFCFIYNLSAVYQHDFLLALQPGREAECHDDSHVNLNMKWFSGQKSSSQVFVLISKERRGNKRKRKETRGNVRKRQELQGVRRSGIQTYHFPFRDTPSQLSSQAKLWRNALSPWFLAFPPTVAMDVWMMWLLTQISSLSFFGGNMLGMVLSASMTRPFIALSYGTSPLLSIRSIVLSNFTDDAFFNLAWALRAIARREYLSGFNRNSCLCITIWENMRHFRPFLSSRHFQHFSQRCPGSIFLVFDHG